ncbi:MAG: hypothetical protein QNK89_03425 [Lacinutrix sp.]|uniref:hypothetical protein n=1 Tax=Lacinutrix sp. TaxID=1937692 RepID=UPI0030A1FBE4
MKKNTVLYLILVVLIIMNGFFLLNYLGRPQHKGPKESSDFIAKELQLNETQLEAFKNLERKHHDNMKSIGDDINVYKEVIFEKITTTELNQASIDSLMLLISEKEILKEKELFKRLRGVFDLCNKEQKQRFSAILKKARRNDNRRPEKPRQ